MASIFSGLRRAAPRISKDFFICHRCAKQTRPAMGPLRMPIRANTARTIRFNSSAAAFSKDARANTSPLAALSQSIGKEGRKAVDKTLKEPFFPKQTSNTVAYFLIGSAASVFGLVVFGGLTRLTESGLSITEWRPITGALPPLSLADWESEFTKYKASPEYALLNPHMNLEEFKNIYFMEWGHRLWGRFLGLSFVLPAIYFVTKRRVSKHMAIRLAGIGILLAGQGALGWFMVASGLKDDLFAPGSHPRVSQYRLTAHLGAAFILYTSMIWNGLAILRQNSLLSHPARGLSQLQALASPTLSLFRKSVMGLAILTFITAMSGGLVAGLDAGLIYNEFPRMGVGLAPPKSELFDPFYSRKEDHSDLWWRNMLENPSTVQLNHRILATTAFVAILGLWSYTRFHKGVRAAIPAPGRKGMTGVVHLVLLQAALGISTLIYLVPIPLAAAHQAGSLALLTGVIILGNRVWIPKRTLRMLERAVKQANAVSPTQRTLGMGKAALQADLMAIRRQGPPGMAKN